MSTGNVGGAGGAGGNQPVGDGAKDLSSVSGQEVPQGDQQKMTDAMNTGEKPKEGGKESPLKGDESAVKDAMKEGASKEALVGKQVKDKVAKETIAKHQQKAGGEKAGGEKGEAGDAAKAAAMGGSVQGAQGAGPMGQAAPVAGAGPAGNTKGAEMAELATKMVDQMAASTKGGGEVRMTLGDGNPNLKGMEVVMTRGEDGSLNVRMNASGAEQANYIGQNMDGLMNELNSMNKDNKFTDINVDIQDNQADTGGEDRESQGEYVDTSEENPEDEA